MILSKRKTDYGIENINDDLVLRGSLTILGNDISLNALVYTDNEGFLGNVSFRYNSDGTFSKSISKVLKLDVLSVENLLLNTISFLILRFNIP